MSTTLIKNIILNNASKQIFINGNLIEKIDDVIECQPDIVIDGKGMTAIPGFVNMHTHAAMSLFRGVCEDLPLKQWLPKIWSIEEGLDEEMIYWGTKLAILEMIKSGTTAFLDQYWILSYAAQAAIEMGIRSNHLFVVLDGKDKTKDESIMERCISEYEQSRKWETPLNKFHVSIHAPYTVTEQMIQWTSDFAKAHNLLFHAHLGETRSETLDDIALYGLTPAQYLDSLGVLGPNTSLAHCVWLNDNDIDILSKRKVSVVHNINSNLKISSGYKFKYHELKDAGVNVCIGTDGCASSNNLDIIESMKTSALLQKAWRENPKAMPLQDIFDIATINGAKALGLNAGKIEPGTLADISLINTDSCAFVPNFNFLANLIYSANSSCVDTVICNGKVLMRGRKVEGEEEILNNARLQAYRLCKKYL